MPVPASISVEDAAIFCCGQRDQWKSSALRDAKSPLLQFFFLVVADHFFPETQQKKCNYFLTLQWQLQREMNGERSTHATVNEYSVMEGNKLKKNKFEH